MDFSAIIREVGRGKEGATDLDQDTASALYGAMLDDAVPELELGGLLIAFRVKGESDQEMLGFFRAMQQRLGKLVADPARPMPVVIPTYNGARRLANLTPLLALLLSRFGLPVLVHGPLRDPKRITTAQVFSALGIPPCAGLSEARYRLDTGRVAFVPVGLLSAGLERLLSLRWRLGLRNSTHTLAKLADPFDGRSLRLVSVSHPDYLVKMADFARLSGARMLLLRGTEGEAYANPRRMPKITFFGDGSTAVLCEAEEGSIVSIPALPESMDAQVTAEWITRALAGEVPVPPPLLAQVACCLAAAGLAGNMAEASALVAAAYPE